MFNQNFSVMKARNLFVVLFLAGAFLAGMTSCSKDTKDVTSTDALSVAQDDALADNLFDDALAETDEVNLEADANGFSNDALKSAYLTGSRTVVVDKPDTVNFPKKITITYQNWVGPNGREKNGTIYITVNKRWMRAGYVRTVTFENFSINGYKIEGTKTISYLGLVNAKPTITVKLENGKVITPGGKTIQHQREITRTWENGWQTPLWIWDDVWFVTGSGSGVDRNGFAYTYTIKEALQFHVGCPWAKAGVIEIVIEGKKTITIDFGDGTCDRKFSVTIDGQTTQENGPEGNEGTK